MESEATHVIIDHRLKGVYLVANPTEEQNRDGDWIKAAYIACVSPDGESIQVGEGISGSWPQDDISMLAL